MKIALVLAALLAVATSSVVGRNGKQVKKVQDIPVQHYDWKNWLSKSNSVKPSGNGGDFDWKKFLSNSYNKIPSGLEEYSFSPYDWQKFMSDGQPGVQYYDWKQWLSKKDKSSGASGSDSPSGNGGGFDWKKFLSNSYNKIPSGIEEQYSFSPYDWEQFMSGGLPGVQYYDWKQWLSKKDKSSGASGSDSPSGNDGGFDWKKFLSNSYNKIPSGIEEEYSFSPYDWQQFMSGGLPGVQYYDWKQWLSKKDKSSGASGSDSPSGNDGGFDWKKFLSNSYNKIPSGLEEEYSFSPYDWQKFMSGGLPGVQYYDWKQWLSRSEQEVSENQNEDEYDWKQWLSNSFIPDGVVQFYDWKQWVSKSADRSAKTTRKPAVARTTVPGKGVKRVTKSTAKVGNSKVSSDKYDWRQWLSKSNTGVSTSGKSGKLSNSYVGKLSKSQVGKSTSSGAGGYDWKQWLSKSGSGSGKGGYDWEQWLSKSGGVSGKSGGVSGKSSIVTSVSKVPRSTSDVTGSGSGSAGGYDWKQWLSKSDVSGGVGSYDWKQWLSKSGEVASDSGVDVTSTSGDDQASSVVVSTDDDSSVGQYDWKQWLSKSFDETGSDGASDWKKWMSNSYAEPPSSIQEEYSFSTFDWNKFLSDP